MMDMQQDVPNVSQRTSAYMAVVVATRYELDGPAIESRWG